MASSSKVNWIMPDATYFSILVSGNSISRTCFTAKSSKSLSVLATIFSSIATINSLNARDFQAVIKIGLRIRSICLTSLPLKGSSVVSWQKLQKISTKRKASISPI